MGNGTQCGFCSPGMVMSMYTLLRNNPKPSDIEIRRALEGEGNEFNKLFYNKLFYRIYLSDWVNHAIIINNFFRRFFSSKALVGLQFQTHFLYDVKPSQDFESKINVDWSDLN